MIISFNADDGIAQVFEAALASTGSTKDEVFDSAMRRYILDTIERKTKGTLNHFSQQKETSISRSMSSKGGSEKVQNRIEGWAHKKQTNSLIISSFCRCEKNNHANRNEMYQWCKAKKGSMTSSNFRQHLSSLATDAGNADGKLFILIGDDVSIDPDILSTFEKFRRLFEEMWTED